MEGLAVGPLLQACGPLALYRPTKVANGVPFQQTASLALLQSSSHLSTLRGQWQCAAWDQSLICAGKKKRLATQKKRLGALSLVPGVANQLGEAGSTSAKVFREGASFFSSGYAQEGVWEREEKRWQREEERWLREEQRWEREQARWEAERATWRAQEALLLSKVASLELQLAEAQSAANFSGNTAGSKLAPTQPDSLVELQIQNLKEEAERVQHEVAGQLAALEAQRLADQRQHRSELAALTQALEEARLEARANARAVEAVKVEQSRSSTSATTPPWPASSGVDSRALAREVLSAAIDLPSLGSLSPSTSAPKKAETKSPGSGVASAKAQPKSPSLDDPWAPAPKAEPTVSGSTNGAAGKAPAGALKKLRAGAEGEDVARMQAALEKAGFYCGEEDMEWQTWEDQTESAVRTWQCSVSVPEDGIMTPELLAILYSSSLGGNSPSTTPATSASSSSATTPVQAALSPATALGLGNSPLVPESERYARTAAEAGQEGSVQRVFLLGENRWEDPARLRKPTPGAVPQMEKCLECRGEGAVMCTECEGTGQMNVEEQFLDWAGEDPKCPYCDGVGAVRCSACDGHGIRVP